MSIQFLTPFIIPIGVAVIAGVVDSVTRENQKLEAGTVHLSRKGLEFMFFHFGKYMHHVYLGCFAFDLAAIVSVKQVGESSLFDISYSGQPITNTIFWITLGIVVHLLAYVHTVIIS